MNIASSPSAPPGDTSYVLWFDQVSLDDVGRVGGKNASLGELVQNLTSAGIRVPGGFATTSDLYWRFVEDNNLAPIITTTLKEWKSGAIDLPTAGRRIRQSFLGGQFSQDLSDQILNAYEQLSRNEGQANLDVAVRSSATAEDLPNASFAGQQESFLNVQGSAELIDACRKCLASLFTDRAMVYRDTQGFDHLKVALSIGVQRMVRSDLAGAGVMFTLDTETGFRDVVHIDAAWGLGETVVQGSVDPDSYRVFKPLLHRTDLMPIIERKIGAKAHKLVYAEAASGAQTLLQDTTQTDQHTSVLNDREILDLAKWAVAIEAHYGRPMDIEWAKDGRDGHMFIVQARPETVQASDHQATHKVYALKTKGSLLATGLSIGDRIAAGRVCRLDQAVTPSAFAEGSILVAPTTDPDWVPIMKKAAAIVTDHGGRTSHAAIVSRELGVPAVVGTGDASQKLLDGQEVTVSCAEGDEGFVYAGISDIDVTETDETSAADTSTRLMLNMANPGAAMRWWRLPAKGVGLARMEFIISNQIKVHPLALVHFDSLQDAEAKAQISQLTAGYADKTNDFVDTLARGIASIAATVHPHQVIVRMSDFKTNEYANLLGGRAFEPAEENPMIGWRGASRYYSPDYREGFALECAAIKKVRSELGFGNVIVMIPFCRTLREADLVLEEMSVNGLKRGEDGLEVYVMCEIPANVILASEFADRFDGFSIGSNDLTQLTLGVDRDSERLSDVFDEGNEAVVELIRQVIGRAHEKGRKVGFCGQAPSNKPAYAQMLVELGIDSISVTPDSFLKVAQNVAEAESRQ